MSDNELARANVSAIVDEIARLQKSLGFKIGDPADREAFDTVSRIERKALAAARPAESKRSGVS